MLSGRSLQRMQAVRGGALSALAVDVRAPVSALPQLKSTKDQAKEIREKLQKEHMAGGLIYLEAGEALKRNGMDVYHKFRASSDFLHLTGCDSQPGAGALFDTESGQLHLFLQKMPEEAAFWSGPIPSMEEVAEQYGADRVSYTTDLAAVLAKGCRGRDVHTLPGSSFEALTKALSAHTSPNQPTSPTSSLPSATSDQMGTGSADHANIANGSGSTRVMDALLEKVLARCRSVKTESEIACLLEANRISGLAHIAAWRSVRPGTHEYAVEAAFTSACIAAGSPGLGYPCIVGSGRNAAILHYETNRGLMSERDLVLMDAGAEFRCYTGDITRTFPAGGKFTPQQRDIYNAVLESQELALSMLSRQGSSSNGAGEVTLQDADAAVRRLLLDRLKCLDILDSKASLDELLEAKMDRVFLPHGLGHWLGLDVHDPGPNGPVPRTGLLPGNVITVEPGLYFIDTLLNKAASDKSQARLINWDVLEGFRAVGGVRIEDNIAFLPKKEGESWSEEQGLRLLNLTVTAGVPKVAAEVEELVMSGRM